MLKNKRRSELFFIPYVCALVLAQINHGVEIPKEGDFYLLTAANKAKILEEERTMVLLYLKGEEECPKCPKAKESFSQLLNSYQVAYPNEPNFFIVDCSKEIQLCADRLKSRVLPAADVRVNGKDSFYFGDYSVKTVEEFIKPRLVSRIEKYTPVLFERLRDKQRKEQFVIALLKFKINSKANRLFEGLMRIEIEDKFLDCDQKTECLLLFENREESDLLLIVGDRKSFLKINSEESFKSLLKKYKEFQNPVLIPFGEEFEKKVMIDMNPTLVFVVDNDSPETLESIRVFEDQIKTHRNKLFASLIQKHKLDSKGTNIYARFVENVGIFESALPLMVMVEPDMDTMRFNKYIFSMDKITPLMLHNYIESWHNRRLEPTPKTELNPPLAHEGVPVLTFESFKSRVFVPGQETVVLVHNGLEKCSKSKAMFRVLKMAARETRFKSIAFMMINAARNDLPVFVSQAPSFLIFTEDLWQYPIAFDKPEPTLSELSSILDKRQEMAKPFKTDAEFADDFDLLDEF